MLKQKSCGYEATCVWSVNKVKMIRFQDWHHTLLAVAELSLLLSCCPQSAVLIFVHVPRCRLLINLAQSFFITLGVSHTMLVITKNGFRYHTENNCLSRLSPICGSSLMWLKRRLHNWTRGRSRAWTIGDNGDMHFVSCYWHHPAIIAPANGPNTMTFSQALSQLNTLLSC